MMSPKLGESMQRQCVFLLRKPRLGPGRSSWGRPNKLVLGMLRPWVPPLTQTLNPEFAERLVDTLFPRLSLLSSVAVGFKYVVRWLCRVGGRARSSRWSFEEHFERMIPEFGGGGAPYKGYCLIWRVCGRKFATSKVWCALWSAGIGLTPIGLLPLASQAQSSAAGSDMHWHSGACSWNNPGDQKGFSTP